VRAKFESRKASVVALNVADLVDLMIEHALFEEEQNQIPKARQIYETLINEVAPGHLKSLNALVAFEKRMGSHERVKTLYQKYFQMALNK